MKALLLFSLLFTLNAFAISREGEGRVLSDDGTLFYVDLSCEQAKENALQKAHDYCTRSDRHVVDLNFEPCQINVPEFPQSLILNKVAVQWAIFQCEK